MVRADDNKKNLIFYLDDNHKLPIMLHLSPDGHGAVQVTARFDSNALHYTPNPKFIRNLTSLLDLQYQDGNPVAFQNNGNVFEATLILATGDINAVHKLKLNLNHVEIARIQLSADGFVSSPQYEKENNYSRLTVSETRMLAREMTSVQLAHLPYKVSFSHEIDETCLPVTDLHTHLSAQLTGNDWKNIIEMHQTAIYYPLDLLQLIHTQVMSGADFSVLPKHSILREVDFKPAVNLDYPPLASEKPVIRDKVGNPTEYYQCIDLRDLANSNDWKLQKFFHQFIEQLSIPIDQILGSDEMDTKFYRFRNPLEKNTSLQEDKILEIAKKHAAQHIRYAELSTSEVLTPKWLDAATRAIEKAEKKYPDTHIRLLAGIHRSKSPHDIARDMEKIKIAANNPYVVGMDFMGYESNKGEDLNWSLHEMARWARRTQAKRKQGLTAPYSSDFIIRIHAGETSKNTNNVRHAIDIAQQFNVPIRVAHLVRGSVDEKLTDKAIRNKVILEFIPDSNIALNNVDFPEDIPIKKWVDAGAYCVINSDGAGAYQTTPLQQAKIALFAGLKIADLKKMQTQEHAYIEKRLAHFKPKLQAYEKLYQNHDGFTRYFMEENRITASSELPKRYKDKMPVLIAGASGSNWNMISEAHRLEISLTMRMMTHLFDPNAIFFCTGRAKDRGAEKELDKAVIEDDQKHHEKHRCFDMIATYAGNHDGLTIASGVNWVNKTAGSAENVATNVMKFMAVHKGGYSLFVGGGHFTREFIRLANKHSLDFGLMLGPDGSTNDMARHMEHKHHIFATEDKPLAVAALLHMIGHLGIDTLQAEYKLAATERGLETVITALYDKAVKLAGLSPPPLNRTTD